MRFPLPSPNHYPSSSHGGAHARGGAAASAGVAELIRRAEEGCAAGRTRATREELERALWRLPRDARGGDVSAILRLVARTHYLEGDVDAALDALAASRACAATSGDATAL